MRKFAIISSLSSVCWLGLLAVALPTQAMAQSDDVPSNSASSTGDKPEETSATSVEPEAASKGERVEQAAPTATTPPAGTKSFATAEMGTAPVVAASEKANAAKASDQPATSSSTSNIIGVERVPDSGYPGAPSDSKQGLVDSAVGWDWHLGNTKPKVRGIYGGSLWLTFHGLQWPYLPPQPGEPKLMLGLSGYGWVNTAYEKLISGAPSDQNQKYLRQQGRLVLRATPTYRNGRWFIQGQGELAANSDQSQTPATGPQIPDVDDLWLRAGMWDAFDVQAGRFEGWELYHLGMGLDYNTFERRGARIDGSSYLPPDFYGVTFLYYRPNAQGNVAAHIYFTDWLRLEALTQLGNASGENELGERGALIFDVGWFKLKGGGEYVSASHQSPNVFDHLRQWGFGGTAQFIIDPYIEFGGNFAHGQQDQWNSNDSLNEQLSFTTYSYGGFANLHVIENLIAGGGINYTYKENLYKDANGVPDEFSQTQYFTALQYGVWRQLFLKTVLGYADAHFINNSSIPAPPFYRHMYSARLRASFYF